MDFMLFHGIDNGTIRKGSPKTFWLLAKIKELLAAGQFMVSPAGEDVDPYNEVAWERHERKWEMFERQLSDLYNAARTLDEYGNTRHVLVPMEPDGRD